MTNIDRLTAALTEWGMNVAASVLPNVQIPADSTIGRVMNGFFGIDLSQYNIYSELGFLVEPTMRTAIKPMLQKYLGSFSDEEVKELAMMYAEALRKQAAERGHVNLFGIELGSNAFEGLHQILTSKL